MYALLFIGFHAVSGSRRVLKAAIARNRHTRKKDQKINLSRGS